MSDPLKIGIAGLGTVGAETARILMAEGERIAARAGRTLVLSGVSARDRSKDRGVDLSNVTWFDNPVELATHADTDIYVELMGGPDGPAKSSVEAALQAGQPVVTANKALVAQHGNALAASVDATQGAALLYEAGVAGGIPAVKALREGLAGNAVSRVSGILNGTCNYILTEMETKGAAFADVLLDAQRLGYAEADPTADVGGFDAAHKLAILAAIAFGQQVDFDALEIEGIERIAAEDIATAREMGYRVRLLGVAERTAGGIAQRVRPCLVPLEAPLAQITGVTNAVMLEGDAVGTVVLTGPGAGGGPTASAVLADIIDAARGNAPPVFGMAAQALSRPISAPAGSDRGSHYLRLTLKDRPGALAEVAALLGTENISIQRMRQFDHQGDSAPVSMITHEADRSAVDSALAKIASHDASVAPPVAIRIMAH